MPHIIFKGIKEESMAQISNTLPAKLSPVFGGVPDDWFFLEYIGAQYYYHGAALDSFPMVQVIWYDKGADTKRQVVQAVNEVLEALGYQGIKMFFINLEPECYFAGKQ